MSKLSKETIDKIKADAERYADLFKHGAGYREPAYVDGATEWAGRGHRILDVLEKIAHAPVPANEREYMSWFVTAKNIAGGAISEWEADIDLAKYKEVGNG